jgi:hypothetical protein
MSGQVLCDPFLPTGGDGGIGGHVGATGSSVAKGRLAVGAILGNEVGKAVWPGSVAGAFDGWDDGKAAKGHTKLGGAPRSVCGTRNK